MLIRKGGLDKDILIPKGRERRHMQGGGGGGALKVQTLTLLYTIFDRKGIPFVYLPKKVVPLSYTYRTTFTILFT